MRLLLMRHANTEIVPGRADLDRVLTDLGELEAKSAAEFLQGYEIDRILVSYARRTMQTAKIIQEQIIPTELEITKELYHGDTDTIMDLFSHQDASNKNILVIGHNPLIYEMVLTLADPDSIKYESLISSMMPTARIVTLDFPQISDWKNLSLSKGEITEIFTPKI